MIKQPAWNNSDNSDVPSTQLFIETRITISLDQALNKGITCFGAVRRSRVRRGRVLDTVISIDDGNECLNGIKDSLVLKKERTERGLV